MKKAPASLRSRVIALALTWDGARCPVGKLSAKARAFLAGGSKSPRIPTAKELTQSLLNDEIGEIRLCWVPRLKGGEDVLAHPFAVPGNRRLNFVVTQMTRFENILGIVYQRKKVSRGKPGSARRTKQKN